MNNNSSLVLQAHAQFWDAATIKTLNTHIRLEGQNQAPSTANLFVGRGWSNQSRPRHSATGVSGRVVEALYWRPLRNNRKEGNKYYFLPCELLSACSTGVKRLSINSATI